MTKYYAIEYEKGEQYEQLCADVREPYEFEPIMVCLLHELYDVLETYYEEETYKYERIVNIRPATQEEVENCTHYYW